MLWSLKTLFGDHFFIAEVYVFDEMEYAGFWIRSAAFLIDSILLAILSNGLMFVGLMALEPTAMQTQESAELLVDVIYLVTSVIIPLALVCGCWLIKQATPGKMLFSLKVVHAETLNTISPGQAVWRYFAYVLSSIPLMLGFVWAAFHPKKRALHDLLSKTVVIREESL